MTDIVRAMKNKYKMYPSDSLEWKVVAEMERLRQKEISLSKIIGEHVDILGEKKIEIDKLRELESITWKSVAERLEGENASLIKERDALTKQCDDWQEKVKELKTKFPTITTRDNSLK